MNFADIRCGPPERRTDTLRLQIVNVPFGINGMEFETTSGTIFRSLCSTLWINGAKIHQFEYYLGNQNGYIKVLDDDYQTISAPGISINQLIGGAEVASPTAYQPTVLSESCLMRGAGRMSVASVDTGPGISFSQKVRSAVNFRSPGCLAMEFGEAAKTPFPSTQVWTLVMKKLAIWVFRF